jgi:prepilin-type N-terminal cleavage/methylation domain-containing protein
MKFVGRRGEQGFTLIEMLVVLAILAVLSGVVVVALGNSEHSAHVASCRTERSSVIHAFAASKTSREVEAGVKYSDFLKDSPGYFTTPAIPTTGEITRDPSTLGDATLIECPDISISEVPVGSE